MDGKKVISVIVGMLTIVASLITIGEFIYVHLNQNQIKQDTSVTIDKPTTSNKSNKKEQSYIGKLWHDAFSDERIPVEERWATRQERCDEVEGFFHRFTFGLFYFPIAGIIILLLSCIAAPIIAAFILDDDNFRSVDGIICLIIGFFVALFGIYGLYSLLVWGLGRIF